jgi:hypothetical protein
MSDPKQPPFVPGDKILRTGRSYPMCNMFKQQEYIVHDIFWCCNSLRWRVQILGTGDGEPGWRCIHCAREVSYDTWGADQFVKIDDISEHTTESLLEQLSEPVRELEPV